MNQSFVGFAANRVIIKHEDNVSHKQNDIYNEQKQERIHIDDQFCAGPNCYCGFPAPIKKGDKSMNKLKDGVSPQKKYKVEIIYEIDAESDQKAYETAKEIVKNVGEAQVYITGWSFKEGNIFKAEGC